MGVQIRFEPKTRAITVSEPSSVSSLQNGCYGIMQKGVISLEPEEVLYLIDIRNAQCLDDALNEYKFNALAGIFSKGAKKFFARYFTYKDWRDRGLIPRSISELTDEKYGRNARKPYPGEKFETPKIAVHGLFSPEDLMTIIDEEEVGKELYERYWLGQFGSYKAEQRGRISKLDVFETLFMLKHCKLSLENSNEKDVLKAARKIHEYFDEMYEVFEDWRLRGFILKTGFKFGTHFRIYFPRASPKLGNSEWVHSKHVIHVFPRKSKMLISEWARAIRVAHSVKKTFILAIPGKKLAARKKAETNFDFLLFHRKKGGIEKPSDAGAKPKYLMLSLSEEEYIGGEELAQAIEEAKDIGLEPILAICDRETSVTYYLVKRINLPGSEYEYYEIEWEQP
ncbi:tRNA-splicing endonuclease [Candidatus Gugararchaeum adminiculabundum]|nr:tRNA-splicing endonuclease [Candidatus Gugararchaeum adminiculabundum]